jgi:thiol-disulfide isomerase/thioredoxin
MGKNKASVANKKARQQRSRSSSSTWIWTSIAVLAIAVVVGFIFLLRSLESSTSSVATEKRIPVPPTLLSALENVPMTLLQNVGVGQTINQPAKVNGAPPLTKNGKPEIFYFGAEYCPYCAAERWALIIALSKFGHFSNLSEITSAANDVYPNTHTFSFYKAKYTSPYISFMPVEVYTNQENSAGNGYVPLETPTKQEIGLVQKYDAPPYAQQQGGIPFIDFGNKFIISGSNYSPQILAGLNWTQIATNIYNPTTQVSKGILGSANYIIAMTCDLTNQKPSNVCGLRYIQSLEKTLIKSKT